MSFNPLPHGLHLNDEEHAYAPRNRRTHMVAQHITSMISNGTLSPGARLPNETDLCNHFNVSRTTLREAIQTLRARGLLDVSPGRGSFIRRPELRERLGELALAMNLSAPASAAESGRMIAGLLLQSGPTALAAPLVERQKLFQQIVMADSLPEVNLALEQNWQRALITLGQPAGGRESAALPQTILALLHLLQTPARLTALGDPHEVARSSQCQLQATTALVEGDTVGLVAAVQTWLQPAIRQA